MVGVRNEGRGGTEDIRHAEPPNRGQDTLRAKYVPNLVVIALNAGANVEADATDHGGDPDEQVLI